MKINIENKNHTEVLITLANISNRDSRIDGNILTIGNSNRISSSSITKSEIQHKEPINLRCLGVPGKAFVIKSNDKISITGNTLHVEGNSTLFRTICSENKKIVNDSFKKKIYEMARMIVDLEDEFIDMVYDNHIIEGLDKEDVKKYIRYIADRRLIQLGLKSNFKIKDNPLEWLDWIIGAATHTNFFESKVTEYEVAGLQGDRGSWDEIEEFRIVSRDGCPYCVKAKELIISNGGSFNEQKINDTVERNKFYDSMNLVGSNRSVPQIWKINQDGTEEYIGGYTQLAKR